MTTQWSIRDLDPKKLFEIVPSRNPEISARYSLPVPRWIDETGKPLESLQSDIITEKEALISHKTGIFFSAKKKEWRFSFYNFEDACTQAVKIDGTGAIIFTGPTPNQVKSLEAIIDEVAPDLSTIIPDHLAQILSRAYFDAEIMDRFHESRPVLHRKMERLPDGGTNEDQGTFVFKPIKSACIFLTGQGNFVDGPSETPQIFSDGAFIEFTGKSVQEAEELIDLARTGKLEQIPAVKLISKSVFFRSRRDAKTGKTLDLADIKPQDKPKRSIKPRPISGFPELSPEMRAVEKRWMNTIWQVYESYGFTPIETPAAEDLEVLKNDDEVGGEIFLLTHFQEGQAVQKKERQIALHFDLTVPFARYVAQRYSDLSFPFKRAAIQPVWRAEEAKTGRFRQFYQCDIDVVGDKSLSIEYDAEFPQIMHDLVTKLGIGDVEIAVNNRKILQGFFEGLGIDDDKIADVIRALDKIKKIGQEGVEGILSESLDLGADVIDRAMKLAHIRSNDSGFKDQVSAIGVKSRLLDQGLDELALIMDRLSHLPNGSVTADISLARGLGYYTGTVFEGSLLKHPDIPTILAGGRYDNLAEKFMDTPMPGVGGSFGLTRVFHSLVAKGEIAPGSSTPTQVLIGFYEDHRKSEAIQIAKTLRERGINAEICHEGDQNNYLYGQMQYAGRKNIPYVIILPRGGKPALVRNMGTKKQAEVDILSWNP